MSKVELVTFKGCQSTVDFRRQLDDVIRSENLDVEVEMIFVPSPDEASEIGLYGSPTILIDGAEYQRERRGPDGFF